MPAIDHPPLHLQAGAGQALTIPLEAMPGAGMLWQAQAAPAGCTLTEADRKPAGPGVGGPVLQRFVLTCDAPAEHQLRFEYKRPWEAEVRAVQTVRVRVA